MNPVSINNWGTYKLNEDEPIILDIEPVISVYLQKVSNEVWIAKKVIATSDINEQQSDSHDWSPESQRKEKRDNTDAAAEVIEEQKSSKKKKKELPEDLTWTRWALNSKEFELSITPVFPNLPVVVSPEYEFHLMPGADATFYVRIPIWIQISDNKAKSLKITEIPSIVLSRTWFGSFTDGEICFWFKTTARRNLSDDIYKPHLCTCPVHIQNNSDEELHIDKLCLRAERLSIFQNDVSLWSDLMTIEYKGGNQFSDLVVTGKPPVEAQSAKLIGKPRNPVKVGLTERTFRIINELQAKIG